MGKAIVFTDTGVKAEQKPEVVKAGGVYYTPSYVVNYIVKNTLEGLFRRQGPREEAAATRGPRSRLYAGSFLSSGRIRSCLTGTWITTSTTVLKPLAEKRNPPIRQIPSTDADPGLFNRPSYRLTISERKRILVNNIHGVDIDPQAVEVAKLSLLLKCLEGETA